MAIQKVELTVSQLINDLNEGLTWLKKDDLGYGSIETKYGANEKQIATIRKHPALKDAETNIIIFDIIDDTNAETSKKSTSTRTDNTSQQTSVDVVSKTTEMASTEAADIFANL